MQKGNIQNFDQTNKAPKHKENLMSPKEKEKYILIKYVKSSYNF